MPLVPAAKTAPIDPAAAAERLFDIASRFVRQAIGSRSAAAPAARLLIKATQGSGKTLQSNRALVRYWHFGDVVHSLSPTLEKAEETAAELGQFARDAQSNVPIHVLRGRNAPNPQGAAPDDLKARCASSLATPGRMCLRATLAECIAAQGGNVVKTLCRNGCPFAGSCAHLAQRDAIDDDAGGIFCMAHSAGLVHNMAPAPDLVIVDEDIIAGLPRRTGLPLAVVADVAKQLEPGPRDTLQAIVAALTTSPGAELAALRETGPSGAAVDDKSLARCLDALAGCGKRGWLPRHFCESTVR